MIGNKKSSKFILFIFLALVIVFIVSLLSKEFREPFLKKFSPFSVLSYADLVTLSKPVQHSQGLLLKLDKQLSVPYIFNRNPFFENYKYNKSYLRLSQWNIARGINLNAIKNVFNNSLEGAKHGSFKKELEIISNSDIIALNESDIGMPRTQYRNTVSELAETLNYNFAFATEFIELGPIINMHSLDPKRYVGLHGNAILSKYPIKNAYVIRLPQCYKWFESEIAKQSPVESARRYGAKTIFNQEIQNEVRRGGRCALVADINLPGNEIITVVSTHLEDRCYPDCRYNQINYLFEKLKNHQTPLVIAGDLNTSTTDSAPTSLKKEVKKRLRDRDFVARQVALAIIPLGIPIPGLANLASVALSRAFQYKDPAFPNIPVFFPNHERKLFKYIKDFQFADGETFDVRGDSDRSSNGKRGLLANSNERHLKGFESTFKFVEPRIIAYYKLDWLFVKPKNKRFEPFNGQTLKLVNESYLRRISDHDPITVDLTLARDQKITIAED